MPNRIAVFLRGHKRVWDYLKEDVMPFYESLANEVHYYVTVWNTGFDLNKLKEDFPSDRLKVFQPMSPAGPEYLPMIAPTYQTDFLMGKKYREEYTTGNKYDFILESRFDNWFYDVDLDLYKHQLMDHEFKLGVSNFFTDHISDHLFLCNSSILTLVNARAHACRETPGMFHKAFYDYIMSHNIETYQINWFKTLITRPSVIEVGGDDRNIEISQVTQKWNSSGYTLEEKINLIKQSGCSIEEYVDHTSIYHKEN